MPFYQPRLLCLQRFSKDTINRNVATIAISIKQGMFKTVPCIDTKLDSYVLKYVALKGPPLLETANVADLGGVSCIVLS